MSQDFVRQLQLAKQLEQKAKEAAKGREAAEERIQQATDLLAKVKEMSAASAETERMLTLASQNYADKDYKEALAYAVKSVDASVRARKDRLRDILREAEALLQKVSELGRPDKETLKKLKEAGEDIDSGDIDAALESSREAWDAAERNANRVLSDAFSRAQSALIFAEGLELKVDKQKSALRGCRDALEAGDAGRSAEAINTLLSSLRSLTLEKFVDRAERLGSLLSLERRLPMDLEEAKALLAEGRELISSSKVEEAFSRLESAEQQFSRAFGRRAGEAIRELQARASEMEDLRRGTDLGDLEGQARRLELEERYPEAIALLDQARERVRAAEREVLLRHMAEMQPRLRLAHMVRKDVSEAVVRMEGARKALRGDDFKAALALVTSASEIVEERLEGYDRVEEDLGLTQEMRARCEDLRLSCGDGIRAMSQARRQTLQGDFHGAQEALGQARRSFKVALENHFATYIMRLEMKMATAIRLGADVSEESASLESLTAKVRKGDFELVQGSLVTIADSVEQKALATVGQTISNAETVLSRYAGGEEVERARGSLGKARELLAAKDFQGAQDMANALVSELMADRRRNLDSSMQDAMAYMDMAKELGVESVTLRDRMQRAEELRSLGRLDEASLLADEVASYARSIVGSEVERSCTELMREIAVSRKEGVEVGEPEHLCEMASNALHRGDVNAAFEGTASARKALAEVAAAYERMKEQLKRGETVVQDARASGAEVMEAVEAVTRARTLFSSGKYREVENELERARTIIRTKAPASMLASHLRLTEEVGKMRTRLGLKGEEERLKALGTLEPARIDEQIEGLKAIRKEWEEEITAGLREALQGCQREADKAAAMGHHMGHVQQMLVSGKASLEHRNLADALRAVEVARKEMEQSLQEDRRLSDVLAQLEEALEQLREMKADAGDAVVLLEQARAFRRTGNPTSALDTSRRALERAQNIARERTAKLMGFAGGLTPERENWEDLRPAHKLAEDIETALRGNRFRHANLLARSFREELERVLQDKTLAEEELRKFESRLKEEAKAGLDPPSSRKALERGRAQLAQGRFVQALSTVGAARDELRIASEMYESRLGEYNELRESLNSLEVLDPRKDHVEELLDHSWTALKELKFDSASLYLRRARNGFNEFLTLRANELIWEYNPLHDLIKHLDLRSKFAAEIEDIGRTDVANITPRDLNRLARSVELVRAGMRDVFQDYRERARRSIERASRAGKETGRSWEVWADAESQAKKGDLWEAFSSLESAVSSVGRKAGETPEQLSRLVSEILDKASHNLIVLPATEKAFAEAIDAQKQGRNPMEALKKAVEASRREVRLTYPDISAEVEVAGEAIEGRPMDLVIHLRNEAKHDARKLRAFVFGDAEVRGMVEAELLKAGEGTSGRITVVPNRPGLLSLGISVKCKPLLTDEDVLYDSKFDMDVK